MINPQPLALCFASRAICKMQPALAVMTVSAPVLKMFGSLRRLRRCDISG